MQAKTENEATRKIGGEEIRANNYKKGGNICETYADSICRKYTQDVESASGSKRRKFTKQEHIRKMWSLYRVRCWVFLNCEIPYVFSFIPYVKIFHRVRRHVVNIWDMNSTVLCWRGII